MYLTRQAFHKIRRTYYQFLHGITARRILETPPLTVGTMPLTVLSMVHNRDVMCYLVAIKSFARFVNPRQIVVVCDPSINEFDRYYIKSQVPHVVFRLADEFTHRDIPRGGTWERLYAISEYARSGYVVQLDADTVTMQPPQEVIDAITAGAGFVISGEPDVALASLQEAADKVASWNQPAQGEHIQAAVERSIASCGVPLPRYVRGCSGFTGFPVSDTMTEDMLAFSRIMQRLHGERWVEWGTEQITSNYLAANAQGTTVLPFATYGTPDVLHEASILTHFIGPMRFTSDKYRACTKRAIRQLAAKPAEATLNPSIGVMANTSQ